MWKALDNVSEKITVKSDFTEHYSHVKFVVVAFIFKTSILKPFSDSPKAGINEKNSEATESRVRFHGKRLSCLKHCDPMYRNFFVNKSIDQEKKSLQSLYATNL